jgi:hypothetical protein
MAELEGKLARKRILLLDDDNEVARFEDGCRPPGHVLERAGVKSLIGFRRGILSHSLEPFNDLCSHIRCRRLRTFQESHQLSFETASGFGHLCETETAGGADQTVNRSVKSACTVLAPAVTLEPVPLLHQGL